LQPLSMRRDFAEIGTANVLSEQNDASAEGLTPSSPLTEPGHAAGTYREAECCEVYPGCRSHLKLDDLLPLFGEPFDAETDHVAGLEELRFRLDVLTPGSFAEALSCRALAPFMITS